MTDCPSTQKAVTPKSHGLFVFTNRVFRATSSRSACWPSRPSTSREAIRGITVSVSGRPHVIPSVLVASEGSEMRGAKSEVGVGGGKTVKDQTNDAHHSYAAGYVENKIITHFETRNH